MELLWPSARQSVTGCPEVSARTCQEQTHSKKLQTNLVIVHPYEIGFETTVTRQRDAPVGGRPFVDGKVVTARLELAAGRWRRHDANAVVFGVIGLMNMSENGQANASPRLHAFKEFLAIRESHGVEPGAAHCYRGVVQADHDVFRAALGDRFGQALEFAFAETSARIVFDAAIESDQQPIADFLVSTVGKRGHAAYLLHVGADIVIAGHAMNSHVERQQEFAKPVVGLGRIVLNEIAGDQHTVCAPVTGGVVVENLLQRLCCNGTAELALKIGEQVWIRQVQYPNQTPVSFISTRFYKPVL